MRDSSPKEVYDDPVQEARRYVQNAKDILNEKARLDLETQLYQDRKYVRMAGNILWNGVLLIINAVFLVKKTPKSRPHFDTYRKAIATRDQKLLSLFIGAYETMHIYMGYDGGLDKEACSGAVRMANDIINRCAAMLPS